MFSHLQKMFGFVWSRLLMLFYAQDLSPFVYEKIQRIKSNAIKNATGKNGFPIAFWCGWWDLNPQGVATTGTWIVFFVADATQSTEASAKPFFWYIHWIFSFLQGGYTKLFIQNNINTNRNTKQDIVIPKKGQQTAIFIATFKQLYNYFLTTF